MIDFVVVAFSTRGGKSISAILPNENFLGQNILHTCEVLSDFHVCSLYLGDVMLTYPFHT